MHLLQMCPFFAIATRHIVPVGFFLSIVAVVLKIFIPVLDLFFHLIPHGGNKLLDLHSAL